MRNTADQMIQELHEFRGYGIKPAYTTEAGKTLDDGESWIIEDPNTINGLLDGQHTVFISTIANFILAGTDRPASLVMESQKIPYGKIRHNPYIVTRRIGYGFDTYLRIGMFADGELKQGFAATNLRPLRNEFEKRNLGSTYEYLRLVLMKQIYDLTVPTEIVNDVFEPAPTANGEASKAGDPVDEILDLMVPRLKFIRDNKQKIHDLLRADEVKGSVGTRRRHDVVGHRVTLPVGYRVSADAIQMAQKDGVTLSEGETYRQKHRRGNEELGSIVGHRLTRG